MLSFKKKKDPEGDSETDVSATAITNTEGIELRGCVYLCSRGGASYWVPEGEDNSQFQLIGLLLGLR